MQTVGRKCVALILAAAILLPLAGCSTVGIMASKSEEYELADSLVLSARPNNFVNAVEAAGQSLGYRVSGIDRASNKVLFTNHSSTATGILIGKFRQFRMEVTLNEDGRSVAIAVNASGNFGSANRESLETQVADFKAALLQRFDG